ncbi:DNA-processing protein DprA [Pseudomonas oryzihabitans]|uniref:DNA-processing protein DprA n=1 Tax=Pseudomonas oryzihabitans TaxID=47885 RepID=UPI00135D24BC|nr:DNA-processing protein DprA [Pseudomonas oryzihabitans]MXS19267.1 DNA-processing protein DprA [Pseudomonas oryzihabitans]
MEDRDFWRNEKVAFLAISAMKGVGFWTLHKIALSKTGFKEALKNLETEKLKHLAKDSIITDDFQEELWQEGLNLARLLAADGIRLYLDGEEEFPKKLKEIPDAPKWIFVQGSLDNLSRPSIAVVGTRKPNDDGLFLTKYAIALLSNCDISTVSGLALGIDQLAHTESIRYGIPTVAVLGTGILQNYPRGSEGLRKEILEKGGTIISEYLPHQSYSAENFVRRNRLQAALGDILIPSQWDVKSGTSHTVKYAAKYGKKIINLYLPNSREKRPEILFSETEFQAESYEIPQQTDDLFSSIWQTALNIHIENITEIKPNTDQSPDQEAASEIDQKELQLPLI